MSCERCAPFRQPLPVRGPAELASVVERVRQAVADGVLEYLPFESDRALVGQPSFLALDLAGPWPDVFEYRFCCAQCGRRFRLVAETYHGSGGSWQRD